MRTVNGTMWEKSPTKGKEEIKIYRRYSGQQQPQHQIQQPQHQIQQQQRVMQQPKQPQVQRTPQTQRPLQQQQKQTQAPKQQQYANAQKINRRRVYRYRYKSGADIGNEKDRHKEQDSINKNGQTASKNAEKIGIIKKLEKLVPENLYNPRTKKLFGVLNAEDLLLFALIFIFADSDNEESSLMCLAILYILVSDYIDF